MGTFAQNLRHGVRLMRQQPGFTLVAVLVLAIGIGANSAIFSLVNAFLFRPLALAEPERLVGCYNRSVAQPDTYRAFSYREYRELREQNSVFTDLVAHNLGMVGLLEGDTTRRLFADSISSNYFATFGVPLFRGRAFLPEEEKPGAAVPVVIASYSFWRKTGADPGLVGRTLRLNGRPFTVVGIAPPGFTGTAALISPELYLPLGSYEWVRNDFDDSGLPLDDRASRVLIVIGRLKDGLIQAAADAQLATTAARMEKVLPEDADRTYVVRPLSRLSVSTSPQSDRELRLPALLLQFMAAAVLLVASLNIANMMLARGTARRREIAIRLALGAGRRDVLGQLFTEGLLLAVAGGVAGLLVAYVSTRLLVRSLSGLVPLDFVIRAAPDLRVLAATLAFCLVATVLFGLGPAWNLSRANVAAAMRPGAEEMAGGKPRRLLARRNLLVIGQLALSLMLLSTAGLFLRSALSTANLEPGFRTGDDLLVEVDPGLAGLDRTRGKQVLLELRDRLRGLPGVESASLAATVPFGMISLGRDVQRASDPPPAVGETGKREGVVECGSNVVGEDYFETLGIPLLRGRDFTAADAASERATTVVLDRAAAEKFWPHGEALGQSIRLLASGAGRPAQEAEVVGIAANVQDHIFGQGTTPHVYLPFGPDYQSDMTFHLRLAPQSEEARPRLAAAIRAEVRAVDDRLPILTLRTLRQHLDASFDRWVTATAARMFTIFGVVALVLASVGLYGVRAYAVTRRSREIGIRMALGASAGDTLRLVLREGVALAAVGTAAGLLLALALGRLLAGMLYRVSGSDPLVLAVATVLLAGVSLLACYVPARRAARVAPATTLRAE